MNIGINCGHTKSGAGYGAVGLIKESEHTRLVGQSLINKLRSAKVNAIDCTIDNANTQNEYLAESVALANKQDLDLFISIHFNASQNRKGNGVEIYTYKGEKYESALKICNAISNLGFKNRGIKDGSELYVIKNTIAKAMLIEVCFCDNQSDIDIYNKIGGANTISNTIYNVLMSYVNEDDIFTLQTQLLSKMNKEQFIRWIGELAAQDMKNSGILASVTVAQACLEASYGKSELALNALNLGGMKEILSENNWASEWGGKIYKKWTKEQNDDGSYRDEFANFRKYDNVSDYLKDHSAYLSRAKKNNSLRYKGIIGCTDYRMALQIIKDGNYATSHDYVDNCCRVIEENDLTRFDIADEIAPDGKLWIVQLGAYKSKNNALSFIKRLEKMGIISMLKLYETEE